MESHSRAATSAAATTNSPARAMFCVANTFRYPSWSNHRISVYTCVNATNAAISATTMMTVGSRAPLRRD